MSRLWLFLCGFAWVLGACESADERQRSECERCQKRGESDTGPVTHDLDRLRVAALERPRLGFLAHGIEYDARIIAAQQERGEWTNPESFIKV